MNQDECRALKLIQKDFNIKYEVLNIEDKDEEKWLMSEWALFLKSGYYSTSPVSIEREFVSYLNNVRKWAVIEK
jgi:hypothetical protein